MADHRIILEPASGELVEKKSRFIANIIPVNDESQASQFIEKIKKQYWDAKHNCSAFVIGDNNEVSRCSDDGEPSGTAGRPMLEILTKEGYHNVCVVVTRYFGGVLLGTGGLIRAYQGAVKDGLENAKTARVLLGVRNNITVSYNDIGKALNLASEGGFSMENTQYGENVSFELVAKMEDYDQAINDIINITNGQAVIGEKKEDTIILPD